jgi:hypothetical protein
MRYPVTVQLPACEGHGHFAQTFVARQIIQIRLNEYLSPDPMGVEQPTNGDRSYVEGCLLQGLTPRFPGRRVF